MALDTSFPTELLARTQPTEGDQSGFNAFLQGRKSVLEEQQQKLNMLNLASVIQQRKTENEWKIQDRALELENRPKVANFLSNLSLGNFDAAAQTLATANIPTSQLDEMTRALESARNNREKQKAQERLVTANANIQTALNRITDWTDPTQIAALEKTFMENPEGADKARPYMEHMQRNAQIAKLSADRINATFELEQFKADKREELLRLETKLKDEFQTGKHVTRMEWINRHLNAVAGEGTYNETDAQKKLRFNKAAESLGQIYDRLSPAPNLAPTPAETSPVPVAPLGSKLTQDPATGKLIYTP